MTHLIFWNYLHKTLIEAQVVSNRVFPALVGLKLVVRELLLDPLVNVSQGCLNQFTSKVFLDSIMLIWERCIGYRIMGLGILCFSFQLKLSLLLSFSAVKIVSFLSSQTVKLLLKGL